MEDWKGEPGAVVRDASAADADATGDAISTADTGRAFFVIKQDWGWKNGCSQRAAEKENDAAYQREGHQNRSPAAKSTVGKRIPVPEEL